MSSSQHYHCGHFTVGTLTSELWHAEEIAKRAQTWEAWCSQLLATSVNKTTLSCYMITDMHKVPLFR